MHYPILNILLLASVITQSFALPIQDPDGPAPPPRVTFGTDGRGRHYVPETPQQMPIAHATTVALPTQDPVRPAGAAPPSRVPFGAAGPAGIESHSVPPPFAHAVPTFDTDGNSITAHAVEYDSTIPTFDADGNLINPPATQGTGQVPNIPVSQSQDGLASTARPLAANSPRGFRIIYPNRDQKQFNKQ
jgi:hypothetical protein